jgi:hypothetical protein
MAALSSGSTLVFKAQAAIDLRLRIGVCYRPASLWIPVIKTRALWTKD